MDVSQLLRTARARAGLSQQRLADELGIGRTAVTDWESGRKSPTVRTLDRLLAGCGLQARVALKPLLAELDERVEALTADPSPIDLAPLARLAASLEDGDGLEQVMPGPPPRREGAVTWAWDGATALRLHGYNADSDCPALVVVLDEAARYWMRAVQLRGTSPGGWLYMSWLDGELAEVAESLATSAFSLRGTVQLRVVERMPTTVDLVPEGGDRSYPVLPVEEVERSHPALGEVLARLRHRRSLAS